MPSGGFGNPIVNGIILAFLAPAFYFFYFPPFEHLQLWSRLLSRRINRIPVLRECGCFIFNCNSPVPSK